MAETFPDAYANIETVVICEGVTNIAANVFAGCTKLTKVVFPSGLVVTREKLRGWGLSDAVLDDYVEGDFVIVNKSLLGYVGAADVAELVIPDGIELIDEYALAELSDLERVELPETVKYIGKGAFANDTYLDEAVLPDSVEVIGEGAFENCSWMQTLTMGGGVRSVGDRAFAGCTQLARFTAGARLETIGDCAFSNCWRMQSVSLPKGMRSVASTAFTRCNELTGLVVPTGGAPLSNWFRPVYSQIRNVTVSSGETDICEGMFSGCSQLMTVELPNGIKNIAAEAFRGCSQIVELTLPQSVASIGRAAFYGCSALKSLVVPEAVTVIGESAFRNCSSLSDITLSRSLTVLPDYLFAGCSSLDSFTVPASVTYLGRGFFPSRTTAIYYQGNAPSYHSGAYESASWSLKSYVRQGTLGWDGRSTSRDMPAEWPIDGSYRCAIAWWSPNQFDVTFDANGGIFAPISSSTYACEQITYTWYSLPPYEPTRTGYKFNGYWTEPSGGMRIFTSTGVKLTKAHTLYAQWVGGSVVTVRFNPNGGTVIPNKKDYTAGVPYGSFPVPTREHYVFAGWYTEASGGTKVVEASEVPEADRELFAHWTPCRYTIRFHANNGTSATADQSFTYGETVTLRANTFFCSGCTFAGWALDPGGAAAYADGKKLTDVANIEDGVIHLWACWTGNTYAVRFDSHGGEGVIPNQTFVIGVAQPLSKNVFTRTGFVFSGWALTTDSAVAYADEAVVKNLTTQKGATVVLYAVWTEDGGGGQVDPPPHSVPLYGPWGEAEAVKNPDKLGPTMLTDMSLTINGAAGAMGDVAAAFRSDTGALCGLGKVMDAPGTLTMACYAPTGVKLHFKVWVAASGIENPVVLDCDAKSDLAAPTSGAFLSGHALVVSDNKDLTISLGSADWHTVSFNVLPEDPSPAAVFGSVKAKIAAVTQGIEFWMPGKSSSLKAIEIGKGYWVNTKVDDVEWTVSGKTDPKRKIALEEGWNLVGYAPEAEGAVQAVLKTALAAKAVDYVTYGVEFYPGGTLKKMAPGKAYWVHATKAYTLVYDDGAAGVRALPLRAGALNAVATPTYGPWGESEAVKNPDKLGPTFLTDVEVEIDGEPAEYGDVVAAFRGDTGALCGLGKVMDDSGMLTVVCYAPKGVTLSFKVWLSESGVEEAVVVKCDSASKLSAPESGAFYDGHAVSCSTAELIETIVPGEKVTIDTGYKGYTVSGLPTGLAYSKTSGLITGAATKPTAAEGVVVKFTKSGAETEELTIVVTAIPKVTVGMEGVNSPSDTDGCKVTGAGAYLVGKTVTLKATAPKGVVFMGWGDDEGVVSTQATYSFTMGKENVALVARFKKEVMSVGCEVLSTKESFPAGVLGAEGGIRLDISTESGVKSVKVEKLPAGMKYDAKTGLITGAPTKAGDNKVVITVTAQSGAVAKKEIKVSAEAMPVVAVGKFNGFVSVGEDYLGAFSLTTTDAGKLTAKVVTAAGTVSFSGTCWDAVVNGVYRATLTTKKGERLALTLDTTADWDANQLTGSFTTAAVAATKKTAAVPSRTYAVSAQRNAFGKTWYFAATGDEQRGWTLSAAESAKVAALTVTLKADGTTALAGKLPGLPDAKGKPVTFKVSASGAVNLGGIREGALMADFAPVLTINKVKKVLSITTNLWLDRTTDHTGNFGGVKIAE